MSWPLFYLIAVCVLIADVLFAALTRRHVHVVHDREALFRPRDDQSDHFPNHSHARPNRSGAE
jgi:hypothetical protein